MQGYVYGDEDVVGWDPDRTRRYERCAYRMYFDDLARLMVCLAMQYAALMSPTTTRSSQVQMSPPPMEMPSRTVSAENAHADGAE